MKKATGEIRSKAKDFKEEIQLAFWLHYKILAANINKFTGGALTINYKILQKIKLNFSFYRHPVVSTYWLLISRSLNILL